MAQAVGSLRVNVTANTAQFSSGMRTAGSTVSRFSGVVKSATSILGGFGGALSIAGLGMMVRGQLAAVDATAKFASRLGMATGKLQELHHAATLTGVSTGTLDMAMQRMTRRVNEAAAGTGEAKAAIKELGLDASALTAMGPDKAFRAIADALNAVGSPADRVRLAFKLFDSEGVALVNTLKLGSKGLAEAAAEARKLGMTMTDEAAKKIEDANNAVNRMNGALKGFAMQAAGTAAPAIESLAKSIEKAATWMSKLNPETVSTTIKIVAWAAAFGVAVKVIGLVTKAIGATVAAIKAMTQAQVISMAFAGPAGWAKIAAGAAVAAAAVYGVSAAFESVEKSASAAMATAQQAGPNLGPNQELVGSTMSRSIGGGQQVTIHVVRNLAIAASQTSTAIKSIGAEWGKVQTAIRQFGMTDAQKAIDALMQIPDATDEDIRQIQQLQKEYAKLAEMEEAAAAAKEMDAFARSQDEAKRNQILSNYGTDSGSPMDAIPAALEAGTQAAITQARKNAAAQQKRDQHFAALINQGAEQVRLQAGILDALDDEPVEFDI